MSPVDKPCVTRRRCANCRREFPATREFFYMKPNGHFISYCKPCAGGRAAKKLIVIDRISGTYRRTVRGRVCDELPLAAFRHGEPRADTLRILQYAGYKLEVRG